VLPSALRPSARGVSPKSSIVAVGVPPSVLSKLVSSKTWTRARGVLASLPLKLSGQFWPRRAAVTNARPSPGPANTTSRGSSHVLSVAITRAGVDVVSMTLTESDRRFTTQTWPLLRAATATGSRPTGTDASWVSPRRVDREDLELVVGRIHREQAQAVR
jgi:hypothetical protein